MAWCSIKKGTETILSFTFYIECGKHKKDLESTENKTNKLIKEPSLRVEPGTGYDNIKVNIEYRRKFQKYRVTNAR